MNKNAVFLIVACLMVSGSTGAIAKDNGSLSKDVVDATIQKNMPETGIKAPGTIPSKKPNVSDVINKSKQLKTPAHALNVKNNYSNDVKNYKPGKPAKETLKKKSVGKIEDAANQKRQAGAAGVKGKIAETGIPVQK